MKKSIIALALVSLSAAAYARDARPTLNTARLGVANLFSCEAKDGSDLEVSFTSSSLLGEPTFNVIVDRNALIDRSKHLIDFQQVSTPVGEMVSVIVTRRHIADAPSLVYSIILPQITQRALDQHNNQVEFESVLVEGTLGGFIPPWLSNRSITNSTALSCRASKVYF